MSASNNINQPNRKQSKKSNTRQLEKLQKTLGVKFKNRSLLNTALTHRSFVNEIGGSILDNERLEYFGDSVLALVVNEYLYKHYERYPEGNLAKIKSAVVSEATLSKVARKMNLGSYILMGKGEEQSGGRERPSILANTFEAIIAAVYLDAGFKTCRKFVLNKLKNEIERIDRLAYLRDPKTTLQEYVQKKYKERPVYDLVEEKGPDHQKEFIVNLVIDGRVVVRGEGTSKRKAEMNAAMEALKMIEDNEIGI